VSARRVAIITGGSRGIGAGLVAAYRKQDWSVTASARTIEPSDDLDLLTVEGDITDPATCDRIVEDTVARFGGVDTLINNAGVFISKPFTDYTEDDYADVVGINLTAFFRLTQLTVAQMLVRRGGHIVNITTTLVEHANSAIPSVLVSMTKGGIAAATRSLAIEYATRSIRVNAISPGVIQTPMYPPESYAGSAQLHPIGRIGQVSDIVDGVLFLESASFVTGEILHVDGGQVAGH
jgi:NAD(P)-dependent dehydrogenase (short-subunit alcohol dehydrogenase family)